MTEQIPLFPLNTVLFPGAPLSLHIFEERYRMMIGRCLRDRIPFGVVLIRRGSEVSPDDPWVRRLREMAGDAFELPEGSTVPYEVGTSAQIADSVRLDDGRFYLVALGSQRFRIEAIVEQLPYVVADVTWLAEEAVAPRRAELLQLTDTYARYWEAQTRAAGQVYEPEDLPDDANEASFWLAHRLQVDNTRKQRWLECDLSVRLREMASALRAEMGLLPAAHPAAADGATWGWN